ncbi:MAG: hypothetical protein HDR03_15355, partial [Lachnospiraceae bacterium]|nr:hypothetical protein [Lachnospiraceae bacterium]
MFEHLKMSKKLKQQLSKVLSLALSVAMLAGTIPADMLGGIADVKAAEPTTVTAGEGVTFPTSGAIRSDSVGVAKTDDEGSSYYFDLSSGSTITVQVASNSTGTLTATPSGDLTLTNESNETVTPWSGLETGTYTLTAGADVKLSTISLTLKEITGEPANVSVTVTGENLLSEGDKITFTASGEDTKELTMTSGSIGGTVQLKKGTEYTIGCNNTNVTATTTVDGNPTDKVTFTDDGDLTINLTFYTDENDPGDSITATIEVDKTNANITDDYTITLENADETAGDSDIELEYDAEDTTKTSNLKPNTTYNVKVTPATIRATVGANKATTVTTVASGTMEIKIDLATQIETSVKLSFSGDTEELPEGTEIMLSNSNGDSDDSFDLADTETNNKVNLWIGDTYNLTCTPATVTAKIDNKTSLEVDKDTTDITVDITVTDDEGDEDPDPEPIGVAKKGAHILDMDKEFEGTAKDTVFKTGTLSALGTNDQDNSVYTSADGYFKLHY